MLRTVIALCAGIAAPPGSVPEPPSTSPAPAEGSVPPHAPTTLTATAPPAPPTTPPRRDGLAIRGDGTTAPPLTQRGPSHAAPAMPAPARPSAARRPAADSGLAEVPFPLERRARASIPQARRRSPVVDLRDPFVFPTGARPIPAHLRARLLPDLKDPFAAPRHPRPRGWQVALPGDIRDPFAPGNRIRRDCHGRVISTRDGVQIQRPDAPDEELGPCPTRPTSPLDLRDPFRAS